MALTQKHYIGKLESDLMVKPKQSWCLVRYFGLFPDLKDDCRDHWAYVELLLILSRLSAMEVTKDDNERSKKREATEEVYNKFGYDNENTVYELIHSIFVLENITNFDRIRFMALQFAQERDTIINLIVKSNPIDREKYVEKLCSRTQS